MKRYALIAMMLILIAAPVCAQPMYISEVIEITLRTGPGIDHKVIAMIKSGQPLEILEPGPEWTKVRLPNEKEGYVLSRFLTDKKPNELLLENMKEKYEALQSELERIQNSNQQQEEAKSSLQSELNAKAEQLAELTKSYEALRAESAEYLDLKSKHENTVAQLTEQSQKAAEYEDALIKIQKRLIFRWVLTGAGILLVGFLIGMSSKRQKRRSSLL